jgi:2,3-dimethylmalate lyase
MGRLLGSGNGRRPTLRERFDTGEMVLAPGCYDALGARLIEEAAFPAAYMTGFGSAASRLGRPDVGLMSLPEMVDNARRIVDAVDIPVIADADTGYGNSINVIRTVREYEAAGVSAIHIEDQVMPKKCGHMEGKQVVPAAEMEAKIAAAVAARASPEFMIIARTDARVVEGLDGALDRARLYREAGADALFVEATQTTGEIEAIAAAFPDVPLLFNYAEGGKTLAVTHAIRAALQQIKADGTPIELVPSLPAFGEFLDFIGMDEIRELEARFVEG